MDLATLLSNDAFTPASLTDAINLIPNSYGALGAANLFGFQGISTRTAVIEMRDGVLHLLTSQPLGAPGTPSQKGKRRALNFSIPHFPHDDTILPDAFNVRSFGSTDPIKDASIVVAERLTDMKARHDLTQEWYRIGAIKGVILDGDGEVLYNLFDEFGITKKTISFELGTAATNVKSKCLQVARHIEKNLMGEISNGIEVRVGADFFDKLTSHPKVEAAYAGWAAAQERLGGDLRAGFTFGGLTFIEYSGQVPKSNGTLVDLIDPDMGHAYPVGTRQTFSEYAAPADFNEAVGTRGLRYYAKQKNKDFDRGLDMHTQSNVLALCKRPGVLVELTA